MSYTKVTFCGLNLARLLNRICKDGIKVLSVTKCGQTCTVKIPLKHKKRLLFLLKTNGYNVTDVQNLGTAKFCDFCKRHFVIVFALIFSVVGCAVLSNYCCKIVVSGDLPRDMVIPQMQSLGVTIGTNLSKLNVDNLENALATHLNATYAIVTRKGSVLYVQTVAKKQIDPPINMHKRRDIVATCNGIVQSILCEQGTSVVNVGDFVRKGDLLIVGERHFNDGSAQDVYALGKVVLTRTASAFAEYVGTKTEIQRTGQTQKATHVVLFGKSYGKKSNYESYQTDVKSAFLYPLNLQIQYITYHQTALVTTKATLEECTSILMQQALQQAMQSCDFDVINTQFVTSANGVTAILQGQETIT